MAKSSCSIKVPEQYQGLLPALTRFAIASKGSKEAFAKQLKDLKEFYIDDTVEDFVNTIYTVYSQKIDNFKRRNQGDWTKEDMFALFNERSVQVAEESQNKTDEYLETDLFDDNSELFINNVYGTSTAKDILIKEIKNNLVNCLYIDYDNATEVHTEEQINRNIIAYLEKLYRLILNNFRRLLKDFPYLTLYNEDGTNNLRRLNTILSDTKDDFNIAKLQYYSDGRLYVNRLRALNALFTLNYFDKILLSQLPKKILINHSGGVLSDSLTKYSFNKNNENKNKSWRDDDKDINALDELSITTKEIIETLPVVDEDGNPIPGRTLKAGDIISLNTFLRALAHHKNANVSLGYSIDKMSGEEISEEELFVERMIRSKITNDGRKSLYDLVNDVVNDLANGLKNLYTILSSKHFPYRNYNISKNQRQNILSLFHGVFSENNPKSLYNIYKSSLKNNYGIDELPEFYYTYILLMLGSQEVLESLEYRRIKGKIENVTLKEQANTAQTYYIDNRIGGLFSVNLNKDFNYFEVNTNNLRHDKENIPSIDIIIKRNDGSKITIRKIAKSELLKAFVNNVEIPIDNNLFEQCTDFMLEVTGFDYNKDFIEVLETYQKEYAPMLFRFASNIIYNHSLSKKLYNTISDLDSYKDELKYYFVEENIPSVKESIKQISFTNDKDTNIKVALSKAYDELHHIDRTSTTKDAEGKLIGSNGLDQIATKPTTQWSRSNKENPALANFSLNKLYRGQEFGRDFKGPNGTKKATAFTEAENFIASFMYDYLNEIYGEKGVIKILPSVISDKSRIPKTLFDLNLVSSFYDEKGLPKRYRDLTTEEWMNLTVLELGDYYKSIYDSTVNMWNDFSLALFELSVGDTDLNRAIRLVGNILDYNTNFLNFNLRLSEAVANKAIPEVYRYNKNKLLNDILHYGIILALKKDPNFELTSIIHYTAKNGELKGNALLFDLLYRYGKLENSTSYDAYGLDSGYGTFSEFIESKKIQYVADLLKDDCEILLHDKYCNAFDDNSYKQIKKSGWSKGDNVVFGKITYNYMDNSGNFQTKTINITNKLDLRNNFIYRELNRLKGFPEYESVKDYININSPEFNFEKFIEAIQIYNDTNYSPNIWLKRVHSAIKKATELSDEQISLFVNETYLNNIKEGKGFTISSKDLNVDSKELLTINSKIKSALTPIIGQIKATLNTKPVQTNAIFEMNPFLEKYQITEYMLSSEYMNATVGTHINHPGKSNDLKQRESEAWGQLVKRNVSLTASKYKFALGLIDGIRSQYRVAVIEDDYDFVCNIYGKIDTAKPFDGATFNAITTNYLENKSLKGDLAGIDKKQFIHDYKAGSGTGIIVKTAGFPLTNGRLRDSLMLLRMNRKMLNIKFDAPVDITVDYNGNKLISPRLSKYGDMTYIIDGKIYRTIDVVYTGNPFEAVIVRELLTENGWKLVKDSTPVLLDSNYLIWKQVFGGENSITIKSGDNNKNVNYEYSERSCELLAFAMNRVGTKINDEVLSQNDVDLVMKRSVIDYVITEGAIKQGAANVNSRNAYFDDNYELTTMTLNMYDAGILLDAEHHADDSTLSLMTLVLNVLGARGYSSLEAEETYQALRGLTKDAIKLFDLGQIGILNGDSSSMLEFLADIILRSIKTVGSTDGNLIAALSSTIISEYSKGNKVTYDLIRNNMPISNPATFSKMISSLASILTKRCVRIPFPGSLSVLSPSNRIYKLYRNHLLSHYNGDLSMLGYGDPFTDMGFVKLGRTYRFTYQDGSTEELLIDNPLDYWKIRDKQPISIEENEKIGRDLATYGLTFTDGTNTYNMWDLDAVRDIWENKSDITQLLSVLNELHNGGTVSVRGGNIVTINNLNIEPYELIMTKVYETTFGLKKGDNVLDIINNKLFFVKRTLENLERKVDSKNYDIELKVLNGRHIYLVDSRGEIPGNLTKAEIDTRWDGDQLVQYDINNNKIRTLSSENDSIYIDNKGNEIIVTDNVNYYINNTDFVQIGLSPSTDPNTLGLLLNTLANSNNSIVDAMLSNFMTDETIESIRNGELIDLVAEELIKVLEKGQAQYDEDIEILKKNINTPYPEIVLRNIKSRVVKNLINKGLEIHTSFIKSLDILAARIPAQSHQSFMAMKVVGFDDSGKNTAYVSRMLIYLLGSDFDIDKVSLLGYKFRNGYFVKWSPFMDLSSIEKLRESEQLPFPTGLTVEARIDPKHLQEFHQLVDNYYRTNSISDFAKIIKYVNKLGYVPTSLTMPNLIRNINKHNNYFKGKTDKNALINFISSRMYNISANPINLILGLSGIDDAVGPIKKKANLQPMSIKSKMFAPGSPQSKMSLLILTLSGKEDTGIVASAMKNFEACSLYYYKMLAEGTPEEQQRLLMNIDILGKQCRLLANSYTRNHSNISPEVLEELLKVDNINDAFLQFSALLSLSTDNAKDPTLAKINAGPEMMSLYTAGLMIGLDLNTLIDLMTSPIAWEMNSLMKSNVFNDTGGIFNIDGIFNYLLNGPKTEFNALNKNIKETLKGHVVVYLRKNYPKKYGDLTTATINDNLVYRTILSPNFNLLKALSTKDYSGEVNIREVEINVAKDLQKKYIGLKEYYSKKYQDLLEQYKNQSTNKKLEKELNKTNNIIIETENKLKALDDLLNNKEEANNDIRKTLESQITALAEDLIHLSNSDIKEDFTWLDKSSLKFSRFKRALAKYKSFRRLASTNMIEGIDGNKYNTISAIQILSHIANELARLRPVLSLNQSLPNDLATLLRFLRNFESIFEQRLKEVPNSEFEKSFKEVNNESILINTNKFITDKNYRDLIIKQYDQIKAAVNIFDVMANSPHYFGYMEGLNALVESCKFGSILYKVSDLVSRDILNKYFNVSKNSKLHLKYLKSALNFVTSRINNQFLLSRGIIINIPKGKVILNDGSEVNTNGTEILLGTSTGNANFVRWMENVVFPAWKNGYDGKTPLGSFFDILNDITPISVDKTFNGKATIKYALTANMMPKSDSERSVFKHYKDELTALQGKTLGNYPVLDLLFYYNLIVNNGLSGLNTLTTLFEDIFAEKTNDTIKSYIDFYSVFDKEGKFELGIDFTEDELLQYIAPIERLDLGKLKYIRAYNPNTMEVVLLRQKEKQQNDIDLDSDANDIRSTIEEELLNEFLDAEDLQGPVDTRDFNDLLANSNYELVYENTKKNKYFTNNYYTDPSRISLQGDISIAGDIITIKKLDYTYNNIVSLANANGHKVNSINLILVKKTLRSPEGPKLIIDRDKTLSRILQILEENC